MLTPREILAELPQRSALVVGDICLDRWCRYDPGLTEASRETGIPRLAVVHTEVTPGAGGTIASNLLALGVGRVAVLGAIGLDGHGYELKEALVQRGVSMELLVVSNEVATFTYTKLINGATGIEDQSRVDFVNAKNLPDVVEREIVSHLRTFARAFDVVFVSDQAETRHGGVVTAAVRKTLADVSAADREKVILVDSRVRLELFQNVILKPNRREAEEACNVLWGSVDYQRLRQTLQAPLLFITQGSDGVLVCEDGRETVVPSRRVEQPVDICGAGDSFAAGAGMALGITRSPLDAARFGNLVASITITKKGTGTASPDEVLAAAADEHSGH